MSKFRSHYLIISILLVLGYLYFEQNFLLSIKRIRVISSDNTPHNWEVLTNDFRYTAINIFDKGYVREIDPELHSRLFLYTEETPMKDGLIIVPENSDKVIKVVLPQGFRDGVFELRISANNTFKIGVSDDLKSWRLNDFPSFSMAARYDLNIDKENKSRRNLYLKFVPSRNDSIRVHFDIFQYTSSLAKEKNETEGILFPYEVDIDFKGEEIIRPVIYFNKSDSK